MEWGTWLPENPADVAPIDHTERRHDVTFFYVDVESQENLVYNFLQDFGKRKHCLYEHHVEISSEKLMRYRELCIDAQNPSIISLAVCYFETRTNWKQP
jgi:hypothetical protein